MTDTPLQATISQKAVLYGPEDEILLLLQDEGPWELPGGRIGAGEDPETGLRREVYEETGLLVDVERPVHTSAWRNDRGQDRYAVIYRCRVDSREVRLSSEHVHWRWIPPEAAMEFQLSKDAFRVALERAMLDPARDGRAPRPGSEPHRWMGTDGTNDEREE